MVQDYGVDGLLLWAIDRSVVRVGVRIRIRIWREGGKTAENESKTRMKFVFVLSSAGDWCISVYFLTWQTSWGTVSALRGRKLSPLLPAEHQFFLPARFLSPSAEEETEHEHWGVTGGALLPPNGHIAALHQAGGQQVIPTCLISRKTNTNCH